MPADATNDIVPFVMQHPMFGAHAHIQSIPEWAATEPTYASLCGYTMADLLTAAGPLPLGQADILGHLEGDAHSRRYFQLWRSTRFTGYARATELACRDLLGVEYVEENADAVGEALGRLIGDDPAASYRDLLTNKANLRWMIRDPMETLDFATEAMFPADFVRFTVRCDAWMHLSNRAAVVEIEAVGDRSIHSLADLVEAMQQYISVRLATGRVTCFKMAMPYYRGLDIAEPTTHEAEAAFGRIMNVKVGPTIDMAPQTHGVWSISHPSAEQVRPLQDYLVHQMIRRAEAEGLPLQLHTGYLAGNYGVLNHTRAMDLVPLLIRYPRVRFDLFHAGWPYVEEHAVIGKQFPNVWLNMCWMWAMNPATAERALDSWLACVPHTKILGYGGDTGNPVCEYGYAQQAREGIARVLSRRIERGDFSPAEAREVATAILLENGCRLHGLEA